MRRPTEFPSINRHDVMRAIDFPKIYSRAPGLGHMSFDRRRKTADPRGEGSTMCEISTSMKVPLRGIEFITSHGHAKSLGTTWGGIFLSSAVPPQGSQPPKLREIHRLVYLPESFFPWPWHDGKLPVLLSPAPSTHWTFPWKTNERAGKRHDPRPFPAHACMPFLSKYSTFDLFAISLPQCTHINGTLRALMAQRNCSRCATLKPENKTPSLTVVGKRMKHQIFTFGASLAFFELKGLLKHKV